LVWDKKPHRSQRRNQRSGPHPAWKKEINAILINRKYDNLRKQLQEKYENLIAAAKDEQERETLQKDQKTSAPNWKPSTRLITILIQNGRLLIRLTCLSAKVPTSIQ
jgi:hypothetical protein